MTKDFCIGPLDRCILNMLIGPLLLLNIENPFKTPIFTPDENSISHFITGLTHFSMLLPNIEAVLCLNSARKNAIKIGEKCLLNVII